MGLVVAGGDLDPRNRRHHLKNQKANTLLADLHRPVRDYGLACGCCSETDLHVSPGSRNTFDIRRRARVHRWPRVLCRGSNSLQPFHLAPLRDRRHHVPLLRRALVRSLATKRTRSLPLPVLTSSKHVRHNFGSRLDRVSTGSGSDRVRFLYRDLYWNVMRVSSSITSGRTKRYDLPLRGTSTATGRIPATRRCRLNTFCDTVFNCAAWFFFIMSSMRRLLISELSVPVMVTVSLTLATSNVVPRRAGLDACRSKS